MSHSTTAPLRLTFEVSFDGFEYGAHLAGSSPCGWLRDGRRCSRCAAAAQELPVPESIPAPLGQWASLGNDGGSGPLCEACAVEESIVDAMGPTDFLVHDCGIELGRCGTLVVVGCGWWSRDYFGEHDSGFDVESYAYEDQCLEVA